LIYGFANIHVFANELYNDDGYNINWEMKKSNIVDSFDDKRYSFLVDDSSVFKNNRLNETIIIQLHTDLYPSEIFHFYKDNIPKDLLKHYHEFAALNKIDINIADNLNTLIKESREIDERYFTTKMGFKLGMNKSDAINIYGAPHKTEKDKNTSILIWDYFGNYSTEIIPDSLLSASKFGYTLKVYFQDDIAYFINMSNIIP
jgi:hypothetical protein